MSESAFIEVDDLEIFGTDTEVRASLQKGPLRWMEVEMRCASRGCSSPTYCTVNSVPRCVMHALRQLNEMIQKYE
jgi:hypothetical protein